MATSRHFDRMKRLLELERLEEEERTRQLRSERSLRQLQSDGLAILGLEVEDLRYSGSAERLDVDLRRTDRQELPFHSFRVGARALVEGRDGDEIAEASGVVLEIGRDRLTVALDREPDTDMLHGALALLQSSDDVTMRRMEQGLEHACSVSTGRVAQLVRTVILEERPLDFDPHAGRVDHYLDEGLDESQRHAVSRALAGCHVSLVHGPPGTGKTRALVEVVRQAVRRGEKVLATAPTNVAVGNLVESLAGHGVPLVRIGHPARTRPHLREHGFDAKVTAAVDAAVLKDMRAEERALEARLSRRDGSWRETRDRLRDLRRQLRDLHRDARRRVLDEAAVVLATCTGAGDAILSGRTFDLAVIDEAAQCLEPLSYVPLLSANRWVLAGDHCQLPPTVLSQVALREGLAESLFERVARRELQPGEEDPRAMLEVQYRMHRQIMDFISGQLYEGRLRAHESVADATLGDLPPLAFVDTAGAGFDEERIADGESIGNPQEAGILARHLREHLIEGEVVPPSSIAVIAPYSAQVRALRQDLPYEGLEIDTVDAFQGREKDAILVSLVRSNQEGDIGFLSEVRRMNVALSRARRHLWVIGDSATLGRHPYYAAFVDYCEQTGAYDSVWSML